MEANNDVKAQSTRNDSAKTRHDMFLKHHMCKTGSAAQAAITSHLSLHVTQTPLIPVVLKPELIYTERKLHSYTVLFLYTGTNKVLILFDFQSESLWHEVH